MPEVRNIILDVDPGIDDAWTIFLALWAEKRGDLKLRAITLVHGNGDLDNVTKNTIRVLKAAERLDVSK